MKDQMQNSKLQSYIKGGAFQMQESQLRLGCAISPNVTNICYGRYQRH